MCGTRSLRMLREIKSTEENLTSSFKSETKVAGVAYNDFVKLAAGEGNEPAIAVFRQSRDVENIHGKLYEKALGYMIGERETTYYVCRVCGFVSDGVLPEKCPICGAKNEEFVER